MADFLSVVSSAAIGNFGPLIGDVASSFASIISANRSIGGIIANVTVEEVHRDEMMITQHPVETGSPVSDHAFVQPPTVEIHAGFSNSSARSEGYVQEIYAAFLALQKSANPFSVVTGKRNYSSMLARNISVKTNEAAEFSLDITVVCQYVAITKGGTTNNSQITNGSSPQTDAGSGQTVTAPSTPEIVGGSQLVPTPNINGLYSTGALFSPSTTFNPAKQ